MLVNQWTSNLTCCLYVVVFCLLSRRRRRRLRFNCFNFTVFCFSLYFFALINKNSSKRFEKRIFVNITQGLFLKALYLTNKRNLFVNKFNYFNFVFSLFFLLISLNKIEYT